MSLLKTTDLSHPRAARGLRELAGQTPSVVFTSGAVVEDDGEVKIYYGGADTVMALGTTSIEKLLYACKNL